MADERAMKQATTVYSTICEMLDGMDWKYTTHEEDLVITCGARGEDLPVDVIIAVNPNTKVVTFYSPMPYKVTEDKRVEMAVAVCIANDTLVNGSFDFDINSGNIRFRASASYLDSILSAELFKYMIMITVGTVDDYNDKFLMIAKGMLSVQQFAENESSDDE